MKKRYITTTIALMLLSSVVTYAITFFAMQKVTSAQVSEFNKVTSQYARIAEVQNNIENLYVNEYNEDEMIDGALTGMVAYLGDKWSHYMNEEQFAEYIDSSSGSMVGIGVNVVLDTATGGIRVIDVYANSPASRAGVKSGDIITTVNDQKVAEIGYEEAVDLVRGEVENVSSKLFENIGYVKIRSFDLGMSNQFITTVHNLQKQGAKAFILTYETTRVES